MSMYEFKTTGKKRRTRVRLKKDSDDWYTLEPIYTVVGPTQDIIKQITRKLREGLPPTTACALIGINYSTHVKWLQKGKMILQQLEEKEKPFEENFKLYVIYLKETEKAIAQFLEDNIKGLRGELKGEWVRNMTILERRDYLNWGRQVTTNSDGQGLANPDESFL